MGHDDALVAIAVVVVVGVLSAAGRLDSQAVKDIFTLLLGYAFGRQVRPDPTPNEGQKKTP